MQMTYFTSSENPEILRLSSRGGSIADIDNIGILLGL